MDVQQKLRLWLVEHACKFNLESVLKHISPDEVMQDVNQVLEEELFAIDSLTLVLKILETYKCSLETCISSPVIDVSWNKDHHSVVVKALDTAFQQKHFISSRHFVYMISRLKLMALLRLCHEGCPTSEIVRSLNESFPHWNPDIKSNFQAQCKIKDEKVLEKLQNTYSESRKFILRLTVSETCRGTYMEENFKEDMQKIMKQAVSYLNQSLNSLRRKTGSSMIEKIVTGYFHDDPAYTDDPAVLMVQEYVDSRLLETDLLQLTQAINTSSDMHLSEGLFALQADSISEVGSECDTCMGDDNSSVADSEEEVETRVAAFDLAGSTQPFDMSLDHSGILAGATSGLFKPSVSQNIMEIISDSDDGGDVDEENEKEEEK